MKDYDKCKESSYLQYWDENNLYDWAIRQKFPVNNCRRIKDTSQFEVPKLVSTSFEISL